jgi:hypothetical protein
VLAGALPAWGIRAGCATAGSRAPLPRAGPPWWRPATCGGATPTLAAGSASDTLPRQLPMTGESRTRATDGEPRLFSRGWPCNTGDDKDRGILDFLTDRTHMSCDLMVENGWSWDGMA